MHNPLKGHHEPPGVCRECIYCNAFAWSGVVITAHCHHTETGAIGIFNDGVLEWHAWRPISRERFEGIAAQAQRDAEGATEQ